MSRTSPETLSALAEKVERLVNIKVNEGFLHDVDENTVTNNILIELRTALKHARVTDLSDILTINCEAYKYRKPLEIDYGDICVIVQINYSDGSSIEGVGVLEAKIRYRSTGAFSAFKLRQIQRIYKNAPNSYVLLYDYESALLTCSNIDIPYRQICEVCYPHRPKDTHAIVIPTNIILNKRTLNKDVYKFALPFSYQLCYRYFLGLDLNFAKRPVTSAVDFATRRPHRFLMTIGIAHGDRPSDRVPLPAIDEALYTRLEAEGRITEGEG